MVLPGAEECNAEGMACYMRAHRREIDRERTFFVNLDSVSYGEVHFQRSEGAIVNQAMDRRLIELCEEIAAEQGSASGADAGHAARPIRHSFHTDALPAVVRGFRAISIVGAEDGVGPPYYHTAEDTPEKVDAESLRRATQFTIELVRAIDREAGRSRRGQPRGSLPRRCRRRRARHREEHPSGISRAVNADAEHRRGELLWEPSPQMVERSRMTEYRRWLAAERGLSFDDYASMWEWSVIDLEAFWRSIWDFFEVLSDVPPTRALGSREMPGAEWFPGTRVNYAEHVFRDREDSETAILHASELRELRELSWGELRSAVAAAAAGLRSLGVGPGDRVVAYLPNVPEAIVGFLATASIGAIWSSCSPDFGPASVIDRFAQIEPKVLLAVDGYRYGGKDFDRTEVLADLQAEMPSLERTVVLPYLSPDPDLSGLSDAIAWDQLLGRRRRRRAGLRAGPLLRPPLGALLLRHHRAAEGDRPEPGRDPPRAPEEAPPPRRPASRRSPLLVHDHRAG